MSISDKKENLKVLNIYKNVVMLIVGHGPVFDQASYPTHNSFPADKLYTLFKDLGLQLNFKLFAALAIQSGFIPIATFESK